MDELDFDAIDALDNADYSPEAIQDYMGTQGMDIANSGMINTFGTVDLVLNIFMLLTVVAMGYGLYTLAKKMSIKHAWLGWIPLVQYYTMTQVAGLKFLKYFIYPLLAYILALLLTVVLGMSMGTTGFMIGGILVFISYIYMIVMYVKICSSISKRTGRGGWTTAGLFFIPFIMFPVVAYKYKGGENKKSEEKTGTGESVVEEAKEEL